MRKNKEYPKGVPSAKALTGIGKGSGFRKERKMLVIITDPIYGNVTGIEVKFCSWCEGIGCDECNDTGEPAEVN